MTKRVLSLALFAFLLAVGVLFGLHQGLSFAVVAMVIGSSLGMAGTIVASPVIANPNYKSWNITCQDADTTVTFAHGFGSSPPDQIIIQSALANGGGTTTALVSLWGVAAAGTTITLTKENLAGSGGATAGTSVVAKLYAWLPHSAAQ